MDVFVLQLLNGLDKGGAYALIALGLTLVFGTLGVVNFAHGALFMLGAFCAVVINRLLQIETVTVDPNQVTPWGSPMEIRTPLVQAWLGDFGAFLLQFSVPLSILVAVPVMLLAGLVMERGLIRHRGRVKVLAEGDIDRALTVKAHAFSAKAKEKIEAAGGTAELIEEAGSK